MGDEATDVIRALIATIEDWYVQDQGDVIGSAQARRAAHREVESVRRADRLLAKETSPCG